MFQVSARPSTRDISTQRPSPLAARDPNACPRFSLQMASARKAGNEDAVYSHKRALNPLLQRKVGEEQDRRRQAFLKRVRQASDDKKWESRTEQMMRRDFLLRQKQWEMDQARTAPQAPTAPDDEEPIEEPNPMEEVEMVDRILSQEDQEIEELVSLMQHAENADNLNQSQRLMSDYGSDEEEYDQLFIEVMSKVEGHIEGAADAASGQDHQMDMSLG